MNRILILILSMAFIHITQNALPVNFSWANKEGFNYLGNVLNQNYPKRCQSGWALATINALNARLRLRIKNTGYSTPAVSLSSQVLLDCDELDYGCLGGEPSSALRWIRRNNITDDSCNSYAAEGYTNGRSCTSKSKCQACVDGKCKGQPSSKIYAISQIGAVAGEEDIQQEIYQYGPVICGIAATDQFKTYTNGILKDQTAKNTFNHYVSIYGWGETNGVKFWIAQNSYGPAWGEEGSFRIQRGVNSLGIESLCHWASFYDTWTKDIRNDTLPNSQAGIKFPHLQSVSSEQQEKVMEPVPFVGALSPARSQLTPTSCDSSWGFAVTGVMSDVLLRQSGGLSVRAFSVQALLNCGVGSCTKGGDPLQALSFIHKYGLPEEGCQPYQGVSPVKQICTAFDNCANCGGNSIYKENCTDVKGYRRWKIFDYGTAAGESQMRMQIDNHGAIICTLQLTESFRQYKGGIFHEISVAPKPNHYVELVGYGQEGQTKYWLGRNWFGSAWGISGMFKIQAGGDNLGIETKCYWAGSLL